MNLDVSLGVLFYPLPSAESKVVVMKSPLGHPILLQLHRVPDHKQPPLYHHELMSPAYLLVFGSWDDSF